MQPRQRPTLCDLLRCYLVFSEQHVRNSFTALQGGVRQGISERAAAGRSALGTSRT